MLRLRPGYRCDGICPGPAGAAVCGRRGAPRRVRAAPAGTGADLLRGRAQKGSREFDRHESSDYTENDLVVLSMQLRKIKCASLWAAGLGDVKIIRCLPALSCRFPAAAKGVSTCAKSGTLYYYTLMDNVLRLAATSRNQPKATFRGPVQSSTIRPLARPTKDRSWQQLTQAQRG